jgi:hypothetical protein
MLPRDFIRVFPKLDFPIVRRRGNEILSGMETNPINASFMPFKHLDTLDLNPNKGREILAFCKFFFQNGIIPNPHSGIKRGTDNKIFLRMKLRTHHIVTMPGDDIDTRATLIVPNAHRLIVTRGQYPRQLVVEVSGTDVVDVAF